MSECFIHDNYTGKITKTTVIDSYSWAIKLLQMALQCES